MSSNSGIEKSILEAMWDAPKWPIVLGIILVLIGLVILLLPPEQIPLWRKLVGALFSELGFAFLIAFALHSTIEFHSTVVRDKEISRGILSYVYQVDLDDEMFRSTEDNLFRSKFYRTTLDIEYDFISHREDRILLKYTLNYTIKNIGRKQENYDVVTHIEKPTDPKGNGFFEGNPRLGLQRILIDNVLLNSEEIRRADDALGDDEDFVRCLHRIVLGPGQERHIQAVHLLEKYERDSELWRSLIPCAMMNFRVRWRPEMNLRVSAQAVQLLDEFDRLDVDGHSLSATLSKPFFPQNGVYFWWGPREPQA